MKAVSSLVSATWLRNQLSSRTKHLRVLDCSWTALKGGKDDFVSKHIPGASFYDLNHCVTPEPTLPRNLPDPACFGEYMQSLGVSTDSHVVVYDRGGILASARTWWTCRAYGHQSVSVLDGGLRKWEADGFGLESGPGNQITENGDYEVALDGTLITSFDDMAGILKYRSSQVVDARRPEHFCGEEPEPTPFTQKALQGMNQPVPETLHRGHIPGSVNLLEDLVLDPDTKCLLPRDRLIKLFKDVGVDLDKPIVTMCYNGHAATLLALAAHICGKSDASVYYGSWTEWGQKADRGMVQGPYTGHPRSGGG